jgi:hypothetical protein
MKISHVFTIAACLAALPEFALASCGSAFCTVNSSWTAESAMVESGSSLDLRYEYINQDQPRAGSDRIAVGQIPHHHDEVRTRNRNLLATFNHTFESGWGVSVTAPIVDRDHLHVHNHHGEQIPQRWNFTELGDVRVLGRYQLPYLGQAATPVTAGLIFGAKLPTGRTRIANADGERAERSLQPGTGTTDAVIGAYYHQMLPKLNSSWFAQVQVQQAINSHDEFKPGRQFGLDLGYRYGLTDKLGALLQMNLLAKQRDSGAQAEPEDSGGRFVSVSPGLSYALSDTIQIYGFIQKPLYQRVNGVQLTADKAFVIGLSSRF